MNIDIKLVPQFSGLTEYWKDIPNYEGRYQVSNFGRIKSFVGKEKILKQRTTKKGYKKVGLCKNKKQKQHRIHRLVAITFLPNNLNLPEVNHIDGDKANNNLSNLEWCSPSHNMKHSFKTGLRKACSGENHGRAKLTEKQVREIKKLALAGIMTQKEIGNAYNISSVSVNHIKLDRTWKHTA